MSVKTSRSTTTALKWIPGLLCCDALETLLSPEGCDASIIGLSLPRNHAASANGTGLLTAPSGSVGVSVSAGVHIDSGDASGPWPSDAVMSPYKNCEAKIV